MTTLKSKVLKASEFDENKTDAEINRMSNDEPYHSRRHDLIALVLWQHAKDQVILSSVLDELERCREALKRAAYETVCYDISGHRKDICVDALAALEQFQERIGK